MGDSHTPPFDILDFWKIFIVFSQILLFITLYFFDTHERFHYRHYFVQFYTFTTEVAIVGSFSFIYGLFNVFFMRKYLYILPTTEVKTKEP